jgi:RHS repeat-associated protein
MLPLRGLGGSAVLTKFEENNYYPFGLKHKNYNYNLKEIQEVKELKITQEAKPEEGIPEIKEMVFDKKSLLKEEEYFEKMAAIKNEEPTRLVEFVPNSGYLYKYNGKEYQDELGLNVYDYGARNYMPDLGRFANIDRMAEKFDSMTPFQYAGNNPIYFIDVNGEYIDINDPSSGNRYRYANGETQKRQEDGTYKTIDATENLSDFVLKTVAGISGLENSGKTGKGLVDAFSGDKKNVTFEYSEGKSPEAKNGKISLDPNVFTKSWTTEGWQKSPLFVTIGHEMNHISSTNPSNFDTWYKPGVFQGEIGATHVENKIRAESGLPLRTHYGGNSKGPFDVSRLIDNQGNSIYYNRDGNRYSYPNVPQNQQLQATINDIIRATKNGTLTARFNYYENK